MTLLQNISLKPYNTFGIDATAQYFSSFQSIDELKNILENILPSLNSKIPKSQNSLSTLVLGGGSNILLTKDVPGLVMKNDIKGIERVGEDDQYVYLKAGAGENWHRFVMYCVEKGYAGVENLSLIPGNVGASPMQNIGAYGVEIKDVFHELEAVNVQDGTTEKFNLEDCAFGYRESVFKHKYRNRFVITSVTYRLGKKPVFNTSYGAIQAELDRIGVKDFSIAAISRAVVNIRSSKLPDPKEIGNAGSFFKNPVIPDQQFTEIQKQFPAIVSFPSGAGHTKLAAGWLIEQCGWKGYRKGDAGCYPKQALVLVNYGNAKGEEILALSEEIILSVKKKFGVILEREVNII